MNKKDIRRRLEGFDAPEPSPELLDRIKDEIPEELPISEEPPARFQRRREGAHWWQIAAALMLLVGGGWLGWTWMVDPTGPRLSDLASERSTGEPPASARSRQNHAPAAEDLDLAEPLAPPDAAADAPKRAAKAAPSAVSTPARGAESEKAAAGALEESLPVERSASSARADESLQRQIAGAAGRHSKDEVQQRGRNARETISAPAEADRRVREERPAASPPPPALSSPAAMRIASQSEARESKVSAPSTGGTAEPNDQPYGDVFFRSSGVNPFVDTEDDALSTFGLDVDSGAYTLARRYLSDGHLPPPEAIRPEEFINYFGYGDRASAREDFALHAEGAPWPFPRGDRYYAVRFGIRAREVSLAERKPATLIFTVDVSGSMNRENRLELVKGTLLMLLDQLGRDDRIALVTYGTRGEILLQPTSDHEAIRQAIARLQPDGSTNAEEGLMLAYDLANRHYRRGAINRVILCSDGVANVGRTGPDSILERIGASARRGIELTTVGFGMGNYNDVLMEQLADRGNGQYAYVDRPAEAHRVFVENLTGTLQTIARDAKVQVEFNPEAVSRYRLIGYENRDIRDERFRDDTVDAGEIGAGHAVTALYEIKLQPGISREARVATLNLRYKDVDGGDRVVEIDRSIEVRDLHSSWDRAPESLRLATLVATFAEVLKDSFWAKNVSPTDLAGRVRALAEDRADARLDELSALVRAAAPLVEKQRRARNGPDE